VLKALLRSFDIFSLIFFSKAIIPLVMEVNGYDSDPVTGNSVLQRITAVIFVITVLRLVFGKRLGKTFTLVSRNIWLLILLFICIASISWSPYPDVTIRIVGSVLGTTLFAIALRIFYSESELLNLLGWSFIILILLSIVFVVFVPQWGIMTGTLSGDWRGVFIHKNRLGAMAVIAFVFSYLLAEDHKKRTYWFWAAVISVVVLFLSQSLTSILVFAVLFCAIIFRKNILELRTAHTSIVLVVYFALVLNFFGLWELTNTVDLQANTASLSRALGKSETLSGRTIIWDYVIRDIKEKPIWGYGLGAYWLGWEGYSSDIAKLRGIPAAHAHNGFLDTLIGVGGIGLLMFLMTTITGIRNAKKKLVRGYNPKLVILPLILIFFTLFYNLSETSILERSSIFWILFILSVI
jgi:O-antigen ligase